MIEKTSMNRAIKIPAKKQSKHTKVPLEKQIGMVKAELEVLRDYVELLEARIENQGKPRYSLDEAKRKLHLNSL